MPAPKAEPAKPSPIARVIDCITDDNLHDVTFKIHLRRLSLLSASAASSGDPNVYELIKYCAQVWRQLFNKCNHSSRQNFVKYVAREPVLMDFCLKAVLSSLESYSKSIASIKICMFRCSWYVFSCGDKFCVKYVVAIRSS